MTTPLVAPSPFGREHELAQLQQGYLRSLAAGTQQYGSLVEQQLKTRGDIARTMLSNADDLASVFGGMQTGAGLENYLNLPSLRGLQGTELQGPMTGTLDSLRLADLQAGIAAKGRSGRSSGGDGEPKGDMLAEVYDREGNPHQVWLTHREYNQYVDMANEDTAMQKYKPRIIQMKGGPVVESTGPKVIKEFEDGSVAYDDGTTG